MKKLLVALSSLKVKDYESSQQCLSLIQPTLNMPITIFTVVEDRDAIDNEMSELILVGDLDPELKDDFVPATSRREPELSIKLIRLTDEQIQQSKPTQKEIKSEIAMCYDYDYDIAQATQGKECFICGLYLHNTQGTSCVKSHANNTLQGWFALVA